MPFNVLFALDGRKQGAVVGVVVVVVVAVVAVVVVDVVVVCAGLAIVVFAVAGVF